MRRSAALIVTGAVGLAMMSVPASADPKPNVIVGTVFNDTLVGTLHADVIIGLQGRDWMTGRQSGDVLHGGRGNDRLTDWRTARGTDVLIGGPGSNDLCVGNSWDTFAASCERQRVRGG